MLLSPLSSGFVEISFKIVLCVATFRCTQATFRSTYAQYFAVMKRFGNVRMFFESANCLSFRCATAYLCRIHPNKLVIFAAK